MQFIEQIIHIETFQSSFFSKSIFCLLFLSTILFWLKITVLIDFKHLRFSYKISRIFSVNKFCERLRVVIFDKNGNIFATPWSVNLFRISFKVLAFDP